jgi:hypothetical protein
MFGYPPSFLSADFTTIVGNLTIGPTGPFIVPANPNRFAIGFWATSAGPYFVGTSPLVSGANGYPVNTNALPVIFTYPQFGPLVTMQWFIGGYPLGGTAVWDEVIYQPKVGD